MRRLLSMMWITALCSATLATAQSDPAATGQTDKKMKDGEVTVTGCLAEGSTAGHYMLTNAMMSSSAMSKDKMPSEKTTTDRMTSYALSGGEDLKAHLGHKIEVRGNLDKMAHTGTMSDREAMDKDKMTGTTGKDMKGGTITVKSVKMVSATCP